MTQQLRIEGSQKVYLITSKTISAKLWFINNNLLQKMVLAYLARYQEMYGVVLYSFVIMGNHYHIIAKFPNCNKADFCRSFNAMVAKLVKEYVRQFKDGKLWARRYAEQSLPNHEDVENWWQYCALNPVTSGLSKNIAGYETYNSVFDAIDGRTQTFQVFERWKYNEKIRKGTKVSKEDFIKTHTLRFQRLPGYEAYSSEDYRKAVLQKLEKRRLIEIDKRLSGGKGFAPPKALLKTIPGSKPRSTKSSSLRDFRPLVLSICRSTRESEIDLYFNTKRLHKEASLAYLAGNFDAHFPPGTYRPPISKVYLRAPR